MSPTQGNLQPDRLGIVHADCEIARVGTPLPRRIECDFVVDVVDFDVFKALGRGRDLGGCAAVGAEVGDFGSGGDAEVVWTGESVCRAGESEVFGAGVVGRIGRCDLDGGDYGGVVDRDGIVGAGC